MGKPPAFQFYADDFLGGVVAMNNEQRGLYITMLCIQWNNGGVTKDDFESLSSAMAQPLAKRVLSKFKLASDDLYKNERMEIERVKQSEFRANRSESGKAGAKTRWHSHSSAIAQPMANTMAKHSSPSPSPSPNNTGGVASLPRPRFQKPSIGEIHLAAAKIGISHAESDRFFNYYESNGWRVGRNPMKSWINALTNWKNNSYGNQNGKISPTDRNFGIKQSPADKGKEVVEVLRRRQLAKEMAQPELAPPELGGPRQ